MLNTGNKRGFTLVELSLTIGFISVLALTLVYVLINMMNTYQHGLVLKQVNTTGNNIIDEFRGATSNSSAKSIAELCDTVYADTTNREACKGDGAYSFVYLVRTADIYVSGKLKKDVPIYGAFCSGVYSYIWNSGYLFDSKVAKENKDNSDFNRSSLTYFYQNTNGESRSTIEDYHLLRVTDPSRSVCVSKVLQNRGSEGGYSTIANLVNTLTSDFNITKNDDGIIYPAIMDEPFDIITTSSTDNNDEDYGANNLALYDLSIYKPAQDITTRNIFYSGAFILATIEGGIDITASGNYCATPTDYLNENFNYCAINKFNFATQANGE